MDFIKSAGRWLNRLVQRAALVVGACVLFESDLPAQGTGYIQTAPNGRYFQFEDGTPFFPVGLHGAVHIATGTPRSALDAYYRFRARTGVNVLRVLVDGRIEGGLTAAPDYWIEKHDLNDPVPDCGDEFNGGCDLSCSPVYNPAAEETVEFLFDQAEKHGFYLQVCPIVPGMMAAVNGDTHPYLEAQGGPITGSDPFSWTSQLFTNGEAICLEKRRLKWFVERWGDHPNLFSWELMNETELFPNLGDPLQSIANWMSALAAYVQQIDPNHLITASTSSPQATPRNFVYWDRDLQVWNDPAMDVVTYHSYGAYFNEAFAGGQFLSELDTVKYQRLLHTALTEQVIPHTGPPDHPIRPVHNNEELYIDKQKVQFRHDPQTPWSESKLADHFRMSKWVHVASGAAGTPIQLFSGTDFPLSDRTGAVGLWNFRFEDFRTLRALANLTDRIDWSAFSPVNADDRLAAPEFTTMAVADADGGTVLAWLLHDTEVSVPNPVPVVFSGLRNEAHQVIWYSDRTGEVLREDSLSGTGGTLSVPAALFADPNPGWDWNGVHAAVLVRPYQSGYEDINPDTDGDGIIDLLDNCPGTANPTQSDGDGDSVGNACDNCPNVYNRVQADYDEDGVGDLCQGCPYGPYGRGDFYVDFYNGLNSNSGRLGDPWRTILYAQLGTCAGEATLHVATCGNGVIDGDEKCDGAVGCSGGVCSSNCTSCAASPCAQVPAGYGLFAAGPPAVGASDRDPGAWGRALSFFLPLIFVCGAVRAMGKGRWLRPASGRRAQTTAPDPHRR